MGQAVDTVLVIALTFGGIYPVRTLLNIMATGYCDCWHGFTFNPGLRRLSDYQRLGASYEKQPRTMFVVAKTPTAALPFEVEASAFYYREGYRAMILDEGGYVRHTGEDRTQAHTGAIYVEVGGKSASSARDAQYFLRWIDRLEAKLNERSRIPSPGPGPSSEWKFSSRSAPSCTASQQSWLA